jgi:hypothetical protein
VIGDDLSEWNTADAAEAERARRRQEREGAGQGLAVRRDLGAAIERRDVPAFLLADLFEPGFIFSPFLPPD